MPAASSDEWFRAAIARFATLAGTDPFPPHMTLVGEVGVFDRDAVQAAIRGHGQLSVAFVAVDDEDQRFRCVTLRAAPEPLAELRERLLPVMPSGSTDPYRPHLSLLYGDLPPDERRRIVEAARLPASLPEVVVDAVAVWDTSPERWTEWRELDRWPL